MFRAVAFSLLASACACAEPLLFKSGPFEVLSMRGEREGRETLNFLEQLRNALGWQLGSTDLQLTWPLRVVLVEKRDPQYLTPKLGRDAYMMSAYELTPQAVTNVVKLMLDSWPGQLPPDLERGLLQVYSTIKIDGTRITLGTPPASKDRDWSRAHMLSVDPNYSGKLRVLLGNLSKGVESEVAYRNAFSMSREQIENAVNKYIEGGQYGTIPAPSRPLNPRRELVGKEVDNAVAQLAMADLLYAQGDGRARAAYAALGNTPEAKEGMGLMDRTGKDAVTARALVEAANRNIPAEEKRALLMKATAANKRWAEPWRLLAAIDTHPAQKLSALRKVAELEPRNTANWIALAQLQEEAKQFTEAAKSWAVAERSAADPNEREKIRQYRLAGETKRLEAQIAAREEARRKVEEELQALRNKALMDIRAAEARANQGKPVIDPKDLDEYKEGPGTEKLSGTLTRIDCLGKPARLHITHGKQTTRLLVPDPGQVALGGGGQISFTCGAQRGARPVVVEYTPRKDGAQGTVGDVVTIEFTK